MKKSFLLLTLLFLTAVAFAQEKSAPPRISGLMFGDYFYNIEQRDTAKKDLNGFQFRRIFFTADFTLSGSFDSRFRLEAEQTSNSLTPGGRLGVMVKDAYLRWKDIFQGSDFLFGLSPTPAFDVIEGAWGYRSLEKTIMDYTGAVATRDLGVDLKGKLNEEGSLRYWVKIGNNSVNSPEINKYKRFYGSLNFIPVANFQVQIYADYASYPQKYDPFNREFRGNSAFLGSLFLNFMERDKYSFGLEYYYRTQQNNFSANARSGLQNQNGYGVSVFGWVTVTDLIRLIARFDTSDPNTDRGSNRLNLMLGAVDFHIDKSVSIIPNIEAFTYEGTDAKDLIARVTFSYQF